MHATSSCGRYAYAVADGKLAMAVVVTADGRPVARFDARKHAWGDERDLVEVATERTVALPGWGAALAQGLRDAPAIAGLHPSATVLVEPGEVNRVSTLVRHEDLGDGALLFVHRLEASGNYREGAIVSIWKLDPAEPVMQHRFAVQKDCEGTPWVVFNPRGPGATYSPWPGRGYVNRTFDAAEEVLGHRARPHGWNGLHGMLTAHSYAFWKVRLARQGIDIDDRMFGQTRSDLERVADARGWHHETERMAEADRRAEAILAAMRAPGPR